MEDEFVGKEMAESVRGLDVEPNDREEGVESDTDTEGANDHVAGNDNE